MGGSSSRGDRSRPYFPKVPLAKTECDKIARKDTWKDGNLAWENDGCNEKKV